MDSGLSTRMNETLAALLPAATPPSHQYNSNATAVVDLSTAQNEVIRPELLEFFKSTVEDKVTSATFSLPAPNGGDPYLRNVLALFFNSYFNPIHAVKPEHIVLTAGATDAIETLIHAICDDGDSVLVPGPSWHGFHPMLASRANVSIVPAQPPTYANWDNYLVPSLQAVYDFSASKSRIKAVLLCNPHNPLSRCYPKKALLEVMEFCQEHGLHLIVDEIYGCLELGGGEGGFVSALELVEPLRREGAVKVEASRVHVVWSASKVFGMSGFRVGCVVSQQNPTLLRVLSHLTTSHVSKISSLYLASLLSWSQLPTLLNLNSERLTTSYHLLASALRKWNIDFVTPTHGLFLFAKVARRARNVADEKMIFDELARCGVKVCGGSGFKGVEGEFGWARIRFSVEGETMRVALGRMEKVLA